MPRMKTAKSIDYKILECENKLKKLKERCDKVTDELDALYAAKKEFEAKEISRMFSDLGNVNVVFDVFGTDRFVCLNLTH